MWHLVEPVHAVTYFAPEARAAADGAGMRGFWMGYVAQRAAPLGPVTAATVTASFFGFHPDRIARALPDAWGLASPEQLLRVRRTAAAAALRRVVGVLEEDPDPAAEAAELAWRAAAASEVSGRALAAANQALPRPTDPVETLWQATTTLREQRGDGHVAVLVAHGLGPVTAHALKVAAGDTDTPMLRASRSWSDGAWQAAEEDLRTRGVLDAAGTLTADGVAFRDRIEALTDARAAQPWLRLGHAGTERLAALLAPVAEAVLSGGTVPMPNPIGLPVAPEER